MARTIKVRKYEKEDGTQVSSHTREIESRKASDGSDKPLLTNENNYLDKYIEEQKVNTRYTKGIADIELKYGADELEKYEKKQQNKIKNSKELPLEVKFAIHNEVKKFFRDYPNDFLPMNASMFSMFFDEYGVKEVLRYVKSIPEITTKTINDEIVYVNKGFLTEVQKNALEYICNMRHMIHSNPESVYNSESADYIRFVEFIKFGLSEEIAKISGKKIAQKYIINAENMPDNDNDTIYFLDENLSEDERERKILEARNKVVSFVSWWNDKVEDYLREIDKKYGTKYAPMGFARLRY